MANRKLIVEIIGDNRSLSKAFSDSTRQATRFEGTITSIGRSITGAFAAVGVSFGAIAIAGQIRETISAASDLNEQINKTSVVFGDSSKQIVAWSRTTASAFGLSQRAALEAAGGFGQVLETSGLTEQQASQFSRRLVELSADIASFNNIDPTEALDKLRSGLVGEAEPLRRVGVLLSEARVKQEAYRIGLARTGDELTEGQKVQARYALILRDTATAQGDFANTSESLANQQRILAAQIEDLRARIGAALLPIVTRVIRGLNEWLSSTENQRRVQEALERGLRTLTSASSAFLGVVRPLANAAQQVSRHLGGLGNTVKLLLALFVARKVTGFTDAILGLGTASARSAKQVNVLRTSLGRLAAIGVITLGVEIILNRESIDDAVQKFLRAHRLGFLATKQIKLPADVDSAGLTVARNRLADLTGESNILVRALDKVIAKLRETEAAAAEAIRAPGEGRPNIPTQAGIAGRANQGGILSDVLETFSLIDQQFAQAQTFVRSATARAERLAAEASALQAARDRFAEAFGRSELRADKAAVTRGLRDDIAEAQRQEALVLRQIKIEGHTLALDRQLFEIRQKQAELRAEQLARARAGVQAAQFRGLGLTAEGGERVPTIENLRRQLQQVVDRVAGTSLDTKKLRSKLAQIRAVLSGEFGKATEETRAKIRELLDAIRGGFDDIAKGPLTKTTGLNTKKIIEGLGLDPATAAEIRARLSGFNTGGLALAAGTVPANVATGAFVGGPPIIVESHTTIELDGEVLGRSVTRSQQKAARRNPRQKRGPNRIGGV